jgi:hypothetical protein
MYRKRFLGEQLSEFCHVLVLHFSFLQPFFPALHTLRAKSRERVAVRNLS